MNMDNIHPKPHHDVEAMAAVSPFLPHPNMGNDQKERVDATVHGLPDPMNNMPQSTKTSHTFVKKLIPFPPTGDDDDFSYKMDLREAERARAEELKYQLACDLRDIQLKSKTFAETNFDENLEKYIQAQQNYEYMHNLKKYRDRNPFIFNGRNLDDREMLGNVMSGLSNVDLGRPARTGGWNGPVWSTKTVGPLGVTRAKLIGSFLGRLLLAIIAAASLIGPMWLMMIYRTGLHERLVDTTILVAAFALLMACFVDEGKDVFESTAAYAAVLTVFVGLTSESG